MDNRGLLKKRCAMLAACAAVWSVTASVHADQPVHEEQAPGRAHQSESERQDSKAQSGAEAADEARIYTAELRRCEGFSGPQRETCVDAAKRRLGEL